MTRLCWRFSRSPCFAPHLISSRLATLGSSFRFAPLHRKPGPISEYPICPFLFLWSWLGSSRCCGRWRRLGSRSRIGGRRVFRRFAVVRWQHRFDLRVFVRHPAQNGQRRVLLHFQSHSLGLLAYLWQRLHHALPERRFVELNQALNIFHREVLRIDRYHRIGYGTRRRICVELGGERIHKFLHFAGADRSACYVLDLLRNIVLNVLPHIGNFGDIHQVADRCVFGGLKLCCCIRRLRARTSVGVRLRRRRSLRCRARLMLFRRLLCSICS